MEVSTTNRAGVALLLFGLMLCAPVAAAMGRRGNELSDVETE